MKAPLKFLIKFFIFLFLTSIIVSIFAIFSEIVFNRYFSDFENPVLKQRLDLVINNISKSKVIIFGDSRLWTGVNSKTIQLAINQRTMNVSMPRTSIMTAFKSMKVRKIMNSNKLYLLNVDMYSLNDKNHDINQSADFMQMSLSEKVQAYGFDFPIVLVNTWFDLANLYLFVNHNVNAFKPEQIPIAFEYVSKNMDISELEQIKDNKIKPKMYDSFQVDPNLSGIKFRLFSRILKEMGKTNDHYLILYSPIPPSWYKYAFSTKFSKDYQEFVRQVRKEVEQYSNISFIDLQNPAISGLSDNDFFDGIHINGKGSVKFTNYIIKNVINSFTIR